MLSTAHAASAAPIVVLTSGRSYTATTDYGDAMWGAYLNGVCPANSEQLWTVNDIAPGGEVHVPMYGQALYEASGTVNLELAGTELPYTDPPSENPVQYTVGSTTTLVAMSGGFGIYGSAAEMPEVQCAPNSYFAVGNGSPVFWNQSFVVSSGQNGNVMFLLKTRVLADCGNTPAGPGTAELQLVLDGAPVGSTAIQQYAYGQTCHQRTLTASYFAKGLAVGTHTISGRFGVSGLPNLVASGDLGLIFFGD